MSQKFEERVHSAEMFLSFWDGGPQPAAARTLALMMAEEHSRGVRAGALVAIVFNTIGWVVIACLWWLQ